MKPIINSLLECDFYKFTMGQFIYTYYPDVKVTFSFKDRTPHFKLAKMICANESQVREQLDHVRTLRFNKTELHYLRGTNEYGEHMFEEAYLQFLANLQLPDYYLFVDNNDFILEFSGSWKEVTYWETLALSIINELYYQSLLSNLSKFGKETIFAKGKLNLRDKILKLRTPATEVNFCDFGTRRRFSGEWQDYVVETLKNELPEHQFRGTSNTYLAMKHGVIPMGTNAHELQMACAALVKSDNEIRSSQQAVFEKWFKLYGYGLSIALTDTFGSDFFFRTFTKEMAQMWKGLRQDSGDPVKFAHDALYFYLKYGINPKQKLIIFSDGLTVDEIIKLHKMFNHHIPTTFGWGTNLTNDLGLHTLSLVIKLTAAGGNPAVKLSDNLAKAIGNPQEVERYKRIFGYTTNYEKECLV